MKKIIAVIMALAVVCAAFAGCSNGSNNSSTPANNSSNNTQNSSSSSGSQNTANDLGTITLISREDGSGTRTAFIELTGVEAKDANGNKEDQTYQDAVFVNSTDQVLTQVNSNEAAIGYVSLGSLNNTVKALKVEGVEATAENVKAGTYKISRPFMIATKGEASGLTKDFIDFILSKEGQAIVNEEGYISVADDAAAYAGSKPEGKLMVGGSSSVGPVMEKLAEAYMALNTNATIELQVTDSSAGMNGAMDGTLDIGMASRALKDSETAQLTGTQIAIDGIAMIVNNANPAEDMTVETIRQIFTGEVTEWSAVK